MLILYACIKYFEYDSLHRNRTYTYIVVKYLFIYIYNMYVFILHLRTIRTRIKHYINSIIEHVH